MHKEEFITKKTELEDKISSLKSELIKLGQEYIDTNQTYPVGTKLKFTFTGGKVQYGIVKSYYLSWVDVKPRLAKVKKDGTAHKTAEEYIDWWEKPVVEVVTD